ncbi:phage major capsid protein [Nonomuraea mesophila]|uniref:Phage major capsid protein n=1 Tax=Nonomuraea mesophila TaxID=2530382 RepID=A0A4R5EZH5_9ACTN|nr:phage major capsid protein [Nonomuraea mesophila]TDE40504.1 phage major capsid protein [Nonomuraea mesophila]
MNRLAEIDARLEAIRAELLELADTDLDETQAARFDELETEYGTLETEREPLARRAAMIGRVRDTARAAGHNGGRGVESGGNDRGPALVTRTDPYEHLDQVRDRAVAVADLRGRALAAVEQAPAAEIDDTGRERATRLLERGDKHGRIARHMLLTGSPAYRSAFEALLSGIQPWQLSGEEAEALRFADEHRRAAMAEGTPGAGGYLVPFHLDPTIILTNAGSSNPFRQISRVETIATNEWHGVSSAGVTARWRAEADEAEDNSPTFAQPEVPVHAADAYLQASFEVTQDTNIASQVGMLIQDAKDNLEAAAFAVGTGTAQPTGVVTGVAAVAGSRVDGGAAYAVDGVYDLKDAVPQRWRGRGSWVANEAILTLTRQFASGTGPQHAFWADLGMDTPSLLLGRPVYEASAMDGVIATGTNDILLYGDFSQYLIVDRVGMTVAYEPLVKGANQRPTGEVGWYAFWRVGANVLVPNAFRVLRVTAA